MSQNRDAPAYQEYAASVLADLRFRLLPLIARGLLYTMKMECWVNRRLPADPVSLAFILGLLEIEVAEALPAVLPFFAQADGYITCPELDDYRQHIEDRKQKQSTGGKAGAEITNAGKKKGSKDRVSSVDASTPPSRTQVPRRAPRRGGVESLVQKSTDQNSKNQLTGVDLSTPTWSDDDDAAVCSASQYAAARGR